MNNEPLINRIKNDSIIIEYGDDYIIYEDLYKYKGKILKNENWDDLREGFGKMEYENGIFYEGDFKNDVKEGNGKLIFQDGITYEGEFKNDKINGKLKIINKEGKLLFDGIVNKDGELTGYLNQKYESGGEYEGDIKNNLKEGKGKFKFLNGNIYEGEFENDNFHGYGKFICKELYDNGEVFEEIYEGNWENGKKHGRGELKITGYWMEDNINSQNENRKRELLEEELSQKFSRNCRCNYFNNSDPRYEMMFPEGEVYTFY